MTSTRSSARKAAAKNTSRASPQGTSSANSGSAGSKRKGDSDGGPKPKRGKKTGGREQTTIEATMPIEKKEDNTEDVEMKNDDSTAGQGDEETPEPMKSAGVAETKPNPTKKEKSKDAANEKQPAKQDNAQATPNGGTDVVETGELNDDGNDRKDNNSRTDETGKIESKSGTVAEAKSSVERSDDAVKESAEREKTTPPSILEKGIIYFFFRGRVGIDEPSDVGDIARSYMVLRPLPRGSGLGDGPIGDAGNNRLLALPKKVLPAGPKDRFMTFVEKANASMEDIKSTLASSDYATQTAGTRHTPSATPIGEGVYAITTTGRESHLAYILTIPRELNEVQKDVGLQARGSFVTSVKNPQYPGPANTNLPKGPEFPQG